ncbi:thioredoxin domain-containing protein [Poseidonibacter lekithochrous]|uniref:DsbA family protein n=1 Tax=Poseidonibacter lekithochrous TaxID=1904463 RepID=UPI0008FCE03B|nr:thioredoxin domain-containing protein [Poseidonibacter lekithochrous]QKJ23326.1 protein disulfide oxidoreductase, DsbA/G family [Poseidonibacter lekithochrous]
MQNKKIVIISVICLVALFFVGGYIYKNKQNEQIASNVKANYSALVREYSYVKGNPDAKVELVEFLDPACGTCAQFHPYVKEILKQNKGNLKVVYRYAPFHKNSDEIVKMLEASKKQGKYEEVLDLVLVTQRYWVKNHVGQLNILWEILLKSELLDMNKLTDDMKDPKLDAIVKQDLADAKTLGASKTPSFFVNGKPLETFGLDQLIDLIQSEL